MPSAHDRLRALRTVLGAGVGEAEVLIVFGIGSYCVLASINGLQLAQVAGFAVR